jgi:hypothetical protein
MTEDDRMGRALDGVTASGNIAAAAIRVRYRASILNTTVMSENGDHVLMMVPVPDWNDLVEQIDMFVAVANYIAEQEEP